MEFKLAKKCDAEKVYALVQETIKVVYPKYYLKEIVDMFCEFHSRENIINLNYSPLYGESGSKSQSYCV